eukprot:1187233-Prorocentrum_minimum.AAC.1
MVCLIAPVTNESDVQDSQKLGSVCRKRGLVWRSRGDGSGSDRRRVRILHPPQKFCPKKSDSNSRSTKSLPKKSDSNSWSTVRSAVQSLRYSARSANMAKSGRQRVCSREYFVPLTR